MLNSDAENLEKNLQKIPFPEGNKDVRQGRKCLITLSIQQLGVRGEPKILITYFNDNSEKFK